MPNIYVKNIERGLNILVLIGSLAILFMLSLEILGQLPPYDDDFIRKIQFWICVVFLLDFFVRLYCSPKRWRFFFHNFLFLVVSIPFLNITHTFDIHMSHIAFIAVRTIPLVRGAYGLVIMIGWMTRSRITNLFATYITTLFAFIYFASIIFYSLESTVNPLVKTYWNALWWAFMDVTTVGSNIYAVTPIGQILSVFLAALGMMMFPIFTAYITTKFQNKKNETQ